MPAMSWSGPAERASFGGRPRVGARAAASGVVVFHGGPAVPVFLLTVFGKGEKVNLAKAERNELRRVLHRLVAEYRKE